MKKFFKVLGIVTLSALVFNLVNSVAPLLAYLGDVLGGPLFSYLLYSFAHGLIITQIIFASARILRILRG